MRALDQFDLVDVKVGSGVLETWVGGTDLPLLTVCHGSSNSSEAERVPMLSISPSPPAKNFGGGVDTGP
jgi:hypothetical protein